MEDDPQQQTDSEIDYQVIATELQKELASVTNLLTATRQSEAQHKANAEQLKAELATIATGDIEAIRSDYEQKLYAYQHESGLAAFRAGLPGLTHDEAEVAQLIALKGGKRFQHVEGKGILLCDSEGVPEYGSDAKPITPDKAAAQALAKLKPSAGKQAGSLKPWSKDYQGRVQIPRSQALDRSAVAAYVSVEDFDNAKWVIVDDSKFDQPGPVARQLQQSSKGQTLQISRSELGDTRGWCRRNNVDPTKFDDLISSDRIKVVA